MEVRRKLLPDEVALFPPQLMHIFDLFAAAGKEIYLVGGGVRNILTSKPPVNCDLTTNATPEEIQEITKEYEPYYENDFGTVGMAIGDEVYEITTYRSEKGYSDFRHPDQICWGKTLAEDVTRREFTISAVVMSNQELIDLVGGLADFEEGIVRTVGNPEERFGEDALRMMRAIRLAATLSLQIEEKTLAAITRKAPLLANISRERVRDELLKIIGSDYPADGVRLLISTGLMEHVIPEILAARGVDQTGHHTLDVLDHMLESLAGCPSRDPLVRLATLLHDIGKPATKRYHCINC
ncbi:MAG: CCA tRNA nucleotidyltransferase, partial [Microgenomates group bacterium]